MRKETFIYNKHTLRYEKVERTIKDQLVRIFGFLCAVALTSFIFVLLTHRYFPSPREQALLREIDQMELKYTSVSNDLDMMAKVLQNIQDRDAAAHRMIFGMDPVDENVWQGGIGGHDRNRDLATFKESGKMLAELQNKLDKIKNQLSLQSHSLDTIMNLANDREKMFASIPSIKPVRSDKLARNIKLLSGFGMRIHPIHKVRKMHTGIDFTAPRGTAIQSTGDGKVINAEYTSGYGKHVVIDHGYGYQTLYGHMDRIDVKVGQTVKKGQKIGTIGSTGTSTAPHCHYEVIVKGQKVDPIHYCMDGLTPAEYQELVNAAGTANQSFD
ncbi:MAG TPA: M23 family metallopeptidase [Saprospiraceae bacterium]|nr:M23 family metallopeptidase [Saprospiraceae bacterium]